MQKDVALITNPVDIHKLTSDNQRITNAVASFP